MSTWKTLGGIDKFDKTNHITVNSIVTNYFVIKKQIVGDIDISGNISVGKNLYVNQDANFNGNIYSNGSAHVSTNITVEGDITSNNGTGFFNNNLNVGKFLYLGNTANQKYLYGDVNGISINNVSPQATLDIYGNNATAIRTYSSQSATRSILSQNNSQKGIILWTDDSNSTIDFFNDMSISSSYDGFDGRIQYQSGGNVLIDSNNIVKILPKLVVSDLSADMGIKNSTVSIHNDFSENIYLYDVYANENACLQNGLSMVGMDNSAVMFMNMINPNNKGFSIGGGTCPYDSSRNMGTIGMMDVSNVVFIPSQTVISGNSAIKYKTTTGINTYKPRVDSYALDINGPVHVTNGETTVIAKPYWQVNNMKFCRDNMNYGIAIGCPSQITDSSYALQAYYTNDAGKSWYHSDVLSINDGIIENGIKTMNALHVYDSNYAFTYGDGMIGYYTYDGGLHWIEKSFSGLSSTARSLYIDITDSSARFFIGTDENQLYYFDASIGEISSDNNYFSGSNSSFSSYENIGVNGSHVHGYNGNIYIAGNGIYKLNVNNVVYDENVMNSEFTYNDIFAYDDNYVVAVGSSVISYSYDGGTNWTNVSTYVNLTSVYIYDASNAIAVGDNGAIVYTIDGYNWKTAESELFNSAGTGSMLDGSLNHIAIFDKNSFIVSNVKSQYSSSALNIGYTNIVYAFVPNLLNHAENNVMDICGNMIIYGNISIDADESGTNRLEATGNTFYLLNDNVENLYIGADASNIQIGKCDVGKTIFRHPVDISGNLIVDGYVKALGTESTITAVSSLLIDWDTRTDYDVKYALDVSGTAANAKIDGSLNVYGDIHIASTTDVSSDSSGALYVAGGTKIEGNVILSNTTSASSDSSGALYIAGGATIQGNVIAGSSDSSYGLQVYGGSTFSGNVVINSNAIASTSSTGALYIPNGGAKIGGNVYVGKNVYIAGDSNGYPLYVASGTSRFAKNLTIGGTLDVSGNVTFSGTTTSGNTWTTSDYRIKQNIVPLFDLSYCVDHLRPVHYFNTLAQHPQIGFIAHELQEEFAFLVNGEKDGEEYQSVNYTGIIGVLVHEVQELKKQVATLRSGN